ALSLTSPRTAGRGRHAEALAKACRVRGRHRAFLKHAPHPARSFAARHPLPAIRAFTPLFDGLLGRGEENTPGPQLRCSPPSPRHQGVHARLRRALGARERKLPPAHPKPFSIKRDLSRSRRGGPPRGRANAAERE